MIEIEAFVAEVETLGFEVGCLIGWFQESIDRAEGQSGADPADTETFREQIEQGRKHGVAQAKRELRRDLLDRGSLIEALLVATGLVREAAKRTADAFIVKAGV